MNQVMKKITGMNCHWYFDRTSTLVTFCKHHAERVDGVLQAKADERKRGLRKHDVGEGNDEIDDDVGRETRQQVPADDVPGRGAAKLRGQHIFLRSFRQQMRSHAPGKRRPVDHAR